MTLLLASLLKGLATVLGLVLDTLFWVVIIYSLISWVNPDPYNPFVRFLRGTIEPMLKPIRRFVPIVGPGIDFSPLILLLVVYFLRVALVDLLFGYSLQLQRAVLA